MKNEKLMKENVSITPISWNNNCYYALHILTKERERESVKTKQTQAQHLQPFCDKSQ